MSDFHMVVCVKAVPGSTEVKMDPKTNTIVRDGKQAVINPFDASALECALALKDDFIGFGMDVRVTVVSMGIPATESLLRDCIARGADDALLLTDRAFAGADTLATTYALKCGIEHSMRTLTCSSAARWQWTAIRPDRPRAGRRLWGPLRDRRELCAERGIYDVWLAGARSRLRCRRGDGVPGDAVCDDDCQGDWPAAHAEYCRYARGRGCRRARGQRCDVNADPSRCGLAGSPTQVVRSFVPDRDQTCEAVEGTASEQAVKLAKIIEGMA